MPHTEGSQSSQSFFRAKRVPIAESYGSLVLWLKYPFVRSPLCPLWLLCVRSIFARAARNTRVGYSMPHTEGSQSSQSFFAQSASQSRNPMVLWSFGPLVLWSKYPFVRSPLWLLCMRSIFARAARNTRVGYSMPHTEGAQSSQSFFSRKARPYRAALWFSGRRRERRLLVYALSGSLVRATPRPQTHIAFTLLCTKL